MAEIPPFVEANDSFELWMRDQTPIVEEDLDEKHKLMTEDLFPFLRATFFRWAQTWPILCPDLAAGPKVLAVGDLHVENFGTWRDDDSRLVWGINDFDDAFWLSYTNDLVRLATSACLSIEKDRLKPKAICADILAGYRKGLESGGVPFFLAEQDEKLRRLAEGQIKSSKKFWEKLQGKARPVPFESKPAEEAVLASLPNQGKDRAYKLSHRQAGLGSLGRLRLVALTSWHGGFLAREAKPTLLSACLWVDPQAGPRGVLIQTLLGQAKRSPDATLRFANGFMVRRLAPDCVKIELNPKEGDKTLLEEVLPSLLQLMGSELANIHLGTEGTPQILLTDLDHLAKNDERWLQRATETMLEQVRRDFDEWRKHRKEREG